MTIDVGNMPHFSPNQSWQILFTGNLRPVFHNKIVKMIVITLRSKQAGLRRCCWATEGYAIRCAGQLGLGRPRFHLESFVFDLKKKRPLWNEAKLATAVVMLACLPLPSNYAETVICIDEIRYARARNVAGRWTAVQWDAFGMQILINRKSSSTSARPNRIARNLVIYEFELTNLTEPFHSQWRNGHQSIDFERWNLVFKGI